MWEFYWWSIIVLKWIVNNCTDKRVRLQEEKIISKAHYDFLWFFALSIWGILYAKKSWPVCQDWEAWLQQSLPYPVPSWIRAKVASHESLASPTPFLPLHAVNDGDRVGRPVEEVLSHPEILQLDRWPTTNEHPKHLVTSIFTIWIIISITRCVFQYSIIGFEPLIVWPIIGRRRRPGGKFGGRLIKKDSKIPLLNIRLKKAGLGRMYNVQCTL